MKLVQAHELWEEGKLQEALKLLNEIEDKDIDVLHDIGLINLELGEIEVASEIFNDMISKDSEFAGGYYGLAMCMDEIGDTEEALTYYLKTIMIDPEHVAAYIAVGDIYASEKLEECIEYYEAASILSPNYWLPISSMGDYYQSTKEFDKAVEFYLKALDIEPNFWSYHGLGYSYDKLGSVDSAITAYIEGTKLHPYAFTFFNLGVIYKDQQMYEYSLEAYNAALELQDDVVFYYNRGCLYNLMGEVELAKKDLLVSFDRSDSLKDYAHDDFELESLKEWLKSL